MKLRRNTKRGDDIFARHGLLGIDELRRGLIKLDGKPTSLVVPGLKHPIESGVCIEPKVGAESSRVSYCTPSLQPVFIRLVTHHPQAFAKMSFENNKRNLNSKIVRHSLGLTNNLLVLRQITIDMTIKANGKAQTVREPNDRCRPSHRQLLVPLCRSCRNARANLANDSTILRNWF